MKIVSDTHTQDTPTGLVPPGTVFECPDSIAKQKIAQGSAREATENDMAAAVPAVSEGDGGDGSGNDDDRSDKIVDAVMGLDENDKSLWTSDGKPKTEAITAVTGFAVTATERDEAWTLVQD